MGIGQKMNKKKYPKAEKFLKETGMTIDEALKYFEELDVKSLSFTSKPLHLE